MSRRVGGARRNPPASFVASTFKDDLKVTGGSGSDAVVIDGVTVGGFGVNGGANDLVVDPGENTTTYPRDEVRVLNSTVARDLDLRLGNAAIKVARVDDSAVGRDLLITAGAGHDDVDLTSTGVGRDVRIDLGNSNDFLTMNGMDIGGEVVLDAGAGDNDVVLARSTIGGALSLTTGNGYDEVWLAAMTLPGRSNAIVLGGGNDTLSIERTSARSLGLDGGAGTDSVIVLDADRIAELALVNFERRKVQD